MSDFNERGGDASTSLSRRRMLAAGAAAATAVMMPAFSAQAASTTQPGSAAQPASTQPTAAGRYKIAACDWTMLKRQTPGAITRAKECGCDGVETDMGPLSKNPTFDNKFLKDPKFVETYQKALSDNNIEISSLAMSGYYAQSFPEREYEQPLKDCLATCKLLGVKRAFLPLGVSDVANRPWFYNQTVERLKKIGDWSAAAGVTIGIETGLTAESTCHMLDEINSPGIKAYYNFQDGVRSGKDLAKELTLFGKDRLLQIHPTSNDVYWLKDDPAIDMKKVKQALDDMGWSGWLVIERSRQKDHGRDVVLNFSTNAKYLKSIFQGG